MPTAVNPSVADSDRLDPSTPTVPDALRRSNRLHSMSSVVLVAGAAITIVLAWAAEQGHDRNEDRLLQERTKQAAAVLMAALPSIETPLSSAVEVAEQGGGAQTPFRRLMEPIVEVGQPFASASLWRLDVDPPVPVVVVGVEPKLASRPPGEIRDFLGRAATATGLAVLGMLDDDDPRLGYASTTDGGDITFVAYAEAMLPIDRTSVVPPDSAFAGLDNAVYLGGAETLDALLTASTDRLPLTGRRAVETVAFGDTSLLLVMSPTTELGGELLAMLPWLIGAVGGVSTIAAALLVEQLLRRRSRADALAEQNEALYANQLSVSRTLQQSLLPQRLPEIAGLDVAARYAPGVAGLDIGGDWYDVIEIDEHRVMIVVGDVSGRGLEAGTVMASLRYAIRAFASRREDPATILDGLTELLDLVRDRHFATVLCATLDIAEGTIVCANAGHPAPLVVDSTGASFLVTDVGPPIGVSRAAPRGSTWHRLEPGATVILFTDGLFERRGETIDVGMERLRQACPLDAASLEDALDGLLTRQLTHDSHDDSALVGVRWMTSPTN